MRRTGLAFSVALFGLVAALTTRTAAQSSKTTRGTVTAMTGTTVTVQVAGTPMTFTVDDKTVAQAPGAGTASARAATAGKGLNLADVIKTGQNVEVTYRETGGAMHATTIRAVSASAVTPSVAKSSNGKVTSVSADALTINGSSGGGSTFTQTFVIDSNTKVVGKGAGTAAAKQGGRIPASDVIHVGDSVHVSFTAKGDTLHASAVTVTNPAAK
jgi:Domain of unknown function (DUF5666)